MTLGDDMQVVPLTIYGVVQNRTARLFDRDGRSLCSVRVDRIGLPPKRVVRRIIWWNWATRMAQRARSFSQKRLADPWLRKAEVLAMSFRLRRRQQQYLGGRRRLDRFNTTTWHDAALRMVLQAHNRFRRFARSGWVRWSHTVSNNQNKRADAWRSRRT